MLGFLNKIIIFDTWKELFSLKLKSQKQIRQKNRQNNSNQYNKPVEQYSEFQLFKQRLLQLTTMNTQQQVQNVQSINNNLLQQNYKESYIDDLKKYLEYLNQINASLQKSLQLMKNNLRKRIETKQSRLSQQIQRSRLKSKPQQGFLYIQSQQQIQVLIIEQEFSQCKQQKLQQSTQKKSCQLKLNQQNQDIQYLIQDVALQQKLKQFNQQIQKISSQKLTLQQKLKQSNQQIQKIGSQNQRLQKQIFQSDIKFKQINKLRDQQNLRYLILKQSYDDSNNEKQLLQLQINKYKLNQILSLQKTRTQLSLKDSEIKLWTSKFKDIQYTYQLLLKQFKIIEGQKRDYQKYFPNQILYGESRQKRYIIQTLQKRYHSEVQATKLVVKYDPLNLVNLHKYIDGVYNIILLIKLSSGRVIAAFSNQAFRAGEPGKDGFIMAVQDEECYFVREGKRAITYDDFNMIFGNSEIRIKAGELLVFSNFGIATGSYESIVNGSKRKVHDLFKEGQKVNEVPIKSFQIYQVIFKQQ